MNRFLWGFMAFAITSLACFFVFIVKDSFVDAGGVLHEPFYLIPFGWLFTIIGMVSLMIGLTKL